MSEGDGKAATWLFRMVDGKHRSWQDFERWGFLSAGHGNPDCSPLRSLRPGDTVFAFAPGRGYFARGTVTSEAVPPREFIVRGPFVDLQDGLPAGDTLPLDKIYTERRCLRDDQGTPLSELIVGIDWRVIKRRSKAVSRPGMQEPQIAAEALTNNDTMRLLFEAFPDAIS